MSSPDFQDYDRLQSIVLPLTKEVAEYSSKIESEVRWYDYVTYTDKVLKYNFYFQDFGDLMGDRFFGSTQLIDGSDVLIIINTHRSQNSGRVHFTTLHEIAHAYYHLRQHPETVFASNRLSESGGDLVEFEANTMAGFMLISDSAIYDSMLRKLSFYDMVREFECSYQALEVRLRSFLIHNMYTSPYGAKNLVDEYRRKDKNTLIDFIIKTQEMIDAPFYEY